MWKQACLQHCTQARHMPHHHVPPFVQTRCSKCILLCLKNHHSTTDFISSACTPKPQHSGLRWKDSMVSEAPRRDAVTAYCVSCHRETQVNKKVWAQCLQQLLLRTYQQIMSVCIVSSCYHVSNTNFDLLCMFPGPNATLLWSEIFSGILESWTIQPQL